MRQYVAGLLILVIALAGGAQGTSAADVTGSDVTGSEVAESAVAAADPTRYWPDPLSDIVDLGTEERFYWLTRSDRGSVLEFPSTFDRLRIWVGGDSLSGGPAWGLQAEVSGNVRYDLTQDIRRSTGVVTEWFFDWRGYLRDEVSLGGYDVVVLAMGGNDAQRFGGHPDRVGSPEWLERYSARIDEMIRSLDAPGRIVIWVGMPAVEPPTIAGLPAIVNPLAEAVTQRYRRAFYVDAMSVISPDNQFQIYLTGPDGVERQVRVDDGVHYTIAGGRLVAAPILQIIEAHSAPSPT
ncbi:MAG: hypothetical protein ACI91O_000400 [Candidatus Poriferisodalaceae bacterium]|jgi:hypothetical protein